MKKFEYKQIQGYIDVNALNELGAESWELIRISEENKIYLFKREIPFVETKRSDKQLLQESYDHEN